MKKLVLTMVALVAGATFIHAQGLVSLNAGANGTVQTNNLGHIGAASGANIYDVELLDMTAAAWGGLTSQQQTQAQNVWANPSAVSLWTDSGISGTVGAGLSAGHINALGSTGGTTAANWAAPSGTTYSTGGTDYYVVVGWSTDIGTSWTTIAAALAGNTLVTGANTLLGSTVAYYNQPGGGANALPVVNIWATSAGSTGLAGAGTPTGNVAGMLVLSPTPEPTTLALAGMGGIAALFLRRRKA